MTSSDRSVSSNQSDSDEDDLIVPSSKSDFRRQYSDLIESINEFNMSDGLDDSVQHKMNANVRRSKRLFESFESNRGPAEMYLACLHTKMFSDTIRSKSDKIGNSCGFTIEKFVEALKSTNTETGEFSTTKMSTNVVNFEGMYGTKAAPAFSCIYGLFDKDTITTYTPKDKKPRAVRKKKDFDQKNATEHVEVNVTEEQRVAKDTSAVKMSMDLLNILQAHNRQNSKALSLYDFAMDKSSLAKTIENIFYLGFLVRDGRISVTREGLANLVLKPETPPEKEENAERQQHILSFSSQKWKSLVKAAEGEDIITSYQAAQSKQAPRK